MQVTGSLRVSNKQGTIVHARIGQFKRVGLHYRRFWDSCYWEERTYERENSENSKKPAPVVKVGLDFQRDTAIATPLNL